MGIISVSELIGIVKKYFTRLLAFSLAGALVAMFLVSSSQTYTCKLNFKYNYTEAAEGLAPDGVSKLDPYEIRTPTVIQGALDDLGLADNETISVEGIRNHITIKEIVTDLDKEVSDSAALLGEKYDVTPTEYEISYSYDADLGDEFGAKIFDRMIKEYDKFLLNKYYNKKDIADFAKIVADSSADYLEIADAMSTKLDSIIEYLDSLAGYYPDFRSRHTGYSFSELSALYQNLRDIQYAKYYGNIRAGNLAKDSEMIVKSYQAKVKDLTMDLNVDNEMAETYKQEISTFYDSYKATGLYNQASQTQTSTVSSNNRDENVFEGFDREKIINTYDTILLNYTEKATNASATARTIENYNTIIHSYMNDYIAEEDKQRLLRKNEKIFEEISALSKEYSVLANETVTEYYNSRIGDDLIYLITSDVTRDKPVNLLTVFAFIVLFAFSAIGVIVFELYKKLAVENVPESPAEPEPDPVPEDTEDPNEFHRAVYDQYKDGFSEFYLVYQPMIETETGKETNFEVLVRWENEKLGTVSPLKIINCLKDMNLLKDFNAWLLKSACKALASCEGNGKELPVLHINCPKSEVENFGVADLLVKLIGKYKVPAKNICIEIDGSAIADSMEDITLLMDMGVSICIDHFEDKDEENEILELIKPNYIKISSDALYYDMLASDDAEIRDAEQQTYRYFSKIIVKCAKKNIKVCICGVENEEQDKLVSELGFDYKQGFFYTKPRRDIRKKENAK